MLFCWLFHELDGNLLIILVDQAILTAKYDEARDWISQVSNINLRGSSLACMPPNFLLVIVLASHHITILETSKNVAFFTPSYSCSFEEWSGSLPVRIVA
jgi:hypothetical protein